jgi:hypothetical protein
LRRVPRCRSPRTSGFVRPLQDLSVYRSVRTIECGAPRSNASCARSCASPPAFLLNASIRISSCLVELAIVSPDIFPSSSIVVSSCLAYHLVAFRILSSHALNSSTRILDSLCPFNLVSNSSNQKLPTLPSLIRPHQLALRPFKGHDSLHAFHVTCPRYRPRLAHPPSWIVLIDAPIHEWTPSHERTCGLV